MHAAQTRRDGDQLTDARYETADERRDVAFLAKKLSELKLPAVMTIDESDKKIAKTVVETSDQKDTPILEMNSMQSVTEKDVLDGATYLGIMESNLEVLTKAIKE